MSKSRNPQNKGVKPVMLQVLITAGVIYVVVLLLMAVLQRNFLYYPSAHLPSRSESGAERMAEVHYTTEDGLELVAWEQPPSDADKPWVAIFHGNAGTIAGRAYKARVFLDAGYGVLLVEYRGFGGNPGSPSEAGLFADARAALAHLAGRGIEGKRLVLYGESLGTGVAVAMAHEAAAAGRPVAAVLLEAPLSSAVDVAAKHYPFLPVNLLLKDRFDSLSRIKAIEAPLFVVHGAQDQTVPQVLGRKLYDAALEPKEGLWLGAAEHNDLFDHGLGAAALAFLKRHKI